ncbi:siderophore iron transporter [Leptodontidium sp. MPI-SDFR-AT-0119]|nr:siderophore iron transporter [Leptodontidium sp. MPI-SDFR-AT-0119]
MKAFPTFARATPDAVPAEERTPSESDKEAGVQVNSNNANFEGLTPEFQRGIQKMQATTQVWSTTHLVLAYINIWVIYFVTALQGTMSGALTPYVTSSFQEHSLTATVSIVSSLMSGLCILPLAKIVDIWGRPNGFICSVVLSIVGLVMMAGCNNVETYAAAQVFYGIGQTGVNFALTLFIADTSQLKNRGLMFAFVSSPYIATVWCSGPAAQSFPKHGGFRWGFGTFSIVLPAVCLPLWGLFAWNYRKAKKAGLIPEEKSGRTFAESLKYYAIELDIVGIFLIAAGMALFLLPFSLYSYQKDQWRSPMIIAMIIVGGLLVVAFAMWERYGAPKKYMPFELLADRTVLGAYFSSFLQVVNNLTVTEASYALVVGALIRVNGRFKWIALCFGVPLTILGVGLMLKFRQPDSPLGYIIMCQIFIAFSGGSLVICEQVAVMAATTQQYIAVVIAVENVFTYTGGAIGSTIAGAIWTGVFPKKLVEYLPAESQGNFTSIYGDLTIQLSYPVGSPTRIAIQDAYGEAQKMMIIAATAVLAIAVVCVAFWRDIKVKDFRQVTGNVI